ncbi:MAG TPA: flavin reductase [Miltoncostaeaceae bacterium]|nr:flavin reductase [Miltoncostaeaceae bacterium]
MTSTAPQLDVLRAPGVTPALLRRTMGHFATGVTVVTARDRAGRTFGTTANSLTSVSLEPPLLLVCLTHGSETLAAIRDAGRFGVNVLRAGQRDLSERFARPADARTWFGVRTHVSGGVPVLDDALAALECELHETVEAGDHHVVFGRVLAADHIDDDPAPLLYFRGGYAGLGDEPPAPEPPAPPVEVRLPTELGDLRVTHLGDEDPSRVSVAVSVGDPHGIGGALLHLHRGCLLGDALGSTACRGRAALHGALALMGPSHPGVVVYHRDDGGFAGCCRAGGEPTAPGPHEITAVRRAARALRLRDVRLIGTAADAEALAHAGVRVAELITV